MLFLLFFGINSASAQKTWDGGASTTNWGDANNWSPNGVPTSSDNVVLSGNGITIKVNTSTATCNSIIIGGTAANTDAILTFETSGSPKLTVVNSVTVGGSGSTNNNRSGKITFVNGATLEAGSVVLTQSTSGDDNPGTITMTGGSTLITGSLAVGQGSATWTPSTGTVVLKSTNTLPATVFTNFNNLIINSGTTTTSGVSFSITGTMTVDGTLTPGATSHVISGAGTVTGSGTIKTNLTSTTALTTQYTISTKTLSNLIVNFSGANQSIASTATVGNYGGLITSGSGTKTLLGAITVNDNITTETGTTLDVSASNFAINLGGDWTKSGTFTQRSGTVTFNGTTQSIGGSTTTFYNLILAGSGTKTFGIATTVSGNLNINTGVIANLGSITTHTAGTLTLGDMGTIGSSKYGSTSTVATAPVYKNNTYFTAGTTGCITVSNSSCVAPTFTISSIPSICAGSTSYVINYSATTGNADLYSISGTGITTVSNGALNAAPSSITVALSSAAVAGTITPSAFTISSSVNGCVSANLSGSVTVTAAPSAGSLSGTQAICSNGTTTFTSNGNSGGAWTSSNTAFATVVSGTGVISGVAEGTATMTYTITGTGGCSNATATRTVTVTAAPSAGSISGTQAICVGGTSNLSSTVSGGTWQSNDSGIATINSTTGVAYGISSGVATMTYTITGTGGCSNATATRTVTVNSAPSVGILSGTQTVCVGATTTFSSTISGELWSSGSIGVATINSSTGVITGVSAGTAIITYTFSGNGVCEDATATRTVTVTAVTSAGTLSGTQTLCSNGTTTLSSSISGGVWTSGSTGVATINSSTGVVTGVSAGTATMTYTITGTGGCSNATATRTVTVTAAPSVGTLSGTQTLCSDGTTTLSSSVSGGAWSSNATGVATINSSTGVVTGVTAGTATMTYTITGTGGCSNATSTRTVTVTASTSAGTLSGTQTLCSNGTTTLSSSISGGAWSSGSTGVATINSSTGVVAGVSAGTATMTYTITGTGGCSNATATRTVTVTAAPSAGSISGTQAICVGGTSNLSSTESGGTWQSDDSGIATINSITGVANGISSGVATMTYTITGTGGCSNATATRTVTVTAAPSAGTLSGTQTLCSNGTTTLSSSISGGAWSSGSTGVATINSSTGVVTGVSAGTATMTYTITGTGGCSNATDTRTVTVNPTFIASVSIASSDVDNTICPGTSVTFTATPTNGGTSPSYQWKLNGSTNVGSNSPTFVTTALANNDLVTVEMTSNETCVTSSPATSNSISTTVDSNLPASVSIISSDNDNTICSGSNVVFTATPNNGGSPNYQWKLNGNSIGSDSNTFTSSSLTNNDVISVVMSSQTCSSGTAVTSNSITTVVNPSSVGGTVNSPTLCYNTAGNILLSGYTGTIQWQQSLDGLTGWANISGATSNTYTTPNLTAANSYRAVVTSGICSSANSNVSVVNVDDENVNTWIGTTGNWNDATKWRCGTVPTGITAVVVSGGSPVINADCSVKSITVSGTGLVTVQSSVTLTMIGGITTTVATQFVLENNANLLQGDSAQNVGPIIVKRNSSSIMRLDYTLWSSPVASQGLYAFSKATLPNRFYKYDTETNLYSNSVGFNLTNLQYPSPLVAPNGINGTDSNNVMFNTGQGYLIRVPWNHPTAPAFWTGYFVGVPNNGTINYTMSDFGVGKRFNLVGNPYPSPISISQFVQDNATNITSSVYFFRKTNGNTTTGSYCEWNDEIFTSNNDNQAFDPNDSVRTGQGFFVEATGAGNTIVFNNGQRVNDADNQFFRQNANNTLTSQNVFWLNLTGTATQFSQTAISYKDYATNGVDRYDAKRMSPGTISLTSLVDGFNMGIQSKSAFVDTDVVLLSMIVPSAGSYSITLDRKSGLFADGQIIYLKDKLLNVDFNLATGSYTFVSEAGTFNDRFEIQYERNSLGVTTPIFNENQVVIYKTPTGGLSIKTGNITMSHVKVFDISGKLLFEKKDINASQTEFNIGLTTEILLVQITSDDGVVVTKKVLFPRTTLKIDKKIEVKSQLAEDE
jgi:uncharacterized protein YjdB